MARAITLLLGALVASSAITGCAFIDDFSRFSFGEGGVPPADGGAGTDGFVPPGTDGGGPGGPELTDVVDIGVGYTHACAVRMGGELVCWGSNTCGELGVILPMDGDRTTRPIVVLSSGVRQIAAGWDYTCALMESGGVQCWGDNLSGQLGDGTEDGRATPAPVVDLSGATAIAVGDDNACAIVAGGNVKCWGANLANELGGGTMETSSSRPVDVPGLTGVTHLSVSGDHVCAIDGASRLRCWGIDNYGQLGTNDGDHTAPAAAVALSGAPTDVGTGTFHTCAIHGGTLSCWGSNETSQLAQSGGGMEYLPVAVALDEEPMRLANGQGYDNTCVIGASGRVWCWGDANLVGAGPMDLPNGRAVPVEATGLTNVVELSSGPQATCARTAEGRVRCWGFNSWGKLGDGTQTDRFVPTPVLAVE
jgi:alpha-tubulin suppressor-like RCC1 family protein